MQSPETIIQTLVISAMIGGLLVFCIAYLMYFYNKKQLSLQILYDKEVAEARHEIQESTLVHFSRELHDNIVPLLILSKLQLQSYISSRSDELTRIKDATEILEKCLGEIRNYSRHLNSDFISENGLWKSIQYFTEQVKKTSGLVIDLKLYGIEKELDNKTEIMLFRIIQESVTNVLKHAFADKVTIAFNFSSDELNLSIEDNGVGFDVTETLRNSYKEGSSGLQNILTRTRMINAQFQITSKKNKGTLLCITIPY